MPDGIETLSALISACGIGLTARRSLWGWPISLIATLLYGWIFLRARLYADALLQIVFCAGIAYGWALWAYDRRHNRLTQPATETTLPTRALPYRVATISTLITLLIGWVWGLSLQKWSDDPTPMMDAALSSASLLAQLWTARRYRESWLLWAVIDLIYTGLFITRSLYPTAILYAGFIALALYGYSAWRPVRTQA